MTAIPPVPSRSTLREHVVDRLRSAILAGALEPGAQLVETHLAEQLHVSRGPLREAIRQLIEEGLLVNIPYGGTFVTELSAGGGPAAIETELRLHSLVYEASGHRLLLDTWRSLSGRLHLYFAVHQRAHGRRGPRPDAHERYVALAKGDDLAAMLAEIDDHMQRGLGTVRQFVTRRSPTPGA